MKLVTTVIVAWLLLAAPLTAHPREPARNPLVGAWQLEEFVDAPEGGPPVYPLGNPPIGLFVFTDDGHVSISLMRNPPKAGPQASSPDPDACIPVWYCSYFGTYEYDAQSSSWTTHVIGGNIPNYLGTEQRRPFKINGDMLIISETYTAEGKTFHGRRVLRRVDPR